VVRWARGGLRTTTANFWGVGLDTTAPSPYRILSWAGPGSNTTDSSVTAPALTPGPCTDKEPFGELRGYAGACLGDEARVRSVSIGRAPALALAPTALARHERRVALIERQRDHRESKASPSRAPGSGPLLPAPRRRRCTAELLASTIVTPIAQGASATQAATRPRRPRAACDPHERSEVDREIRRQPLLRRTELAPRRLWRGQPGTPGHAPASLPPFGLGACPAARDWAGNEVLPRDDTDRRLGTEARTSPALAGTVPPSVVHVVQNQGVHVPRQLPAPVARGRASARTTKWRLEKSSICRYFTDTPGRTRTCDPRLRRPSLYPAELRGPGL
jgi:hypothetical protein